jgi:hypothetical protein
MGDELGHRAGLNEAIFREVNEQIRSLDHELGGDSGTIAVICERGDADCTERRDGWEIVRKVGVAREIAEETDPRS